MKKNSEIAKFGWKKIRIKWNLDLCNRNICVLLEHQSKGKKSIYSLRGTVCNKTFSMFSPWILGQIGLSMTVLEFACHEDSKTPPTCLIWWSFGWDIWGWRQGLTSEESLFGIISIVFNLKYLSQNFIKLNM